MAAENSGKDELMHVKALIRLMEMIAGTVIFISLECSESNKLY